MELRSFVTLSHSSKDAQQGKNQAHNNDKPHKKTDNKWVFRKMADEGRGCDMRNLAVPTGYVNPTAPLKEVLMSATVSLGPLYQFPGWIVNKVSIRLTGSAVRISLRPDRRRKGFRCPHCNRRMG